MSPLIQHSPFKTIGYRECLIGLIIAWLATDQEVCYENLNITQFEKWPWVLESFTLEEEEIYGSGGRSAIIKRLFIRDDPSWKNTVFDMLNYALNQAITSTAAKTGQDDKKNSKLNLPTAGQFRVLGKLFQKEAEKFPDMLHVLEKRPSDTKMKGFTPSAGVSGLGRLKKGFELGHKTELVGVPDIFEAYCTDKEWCWGYLLRPTSESWDSLSAFCDFKKISYEAARLLRQVPDCIVCLVGVFCRLRQQCDDDDSAALWLVFLHEKEQTSFEDLRVLRDVFLKSSLACEYLADKLESAKQQADCEAEHKNNRKPAETKHKKTELTDTEQNILEALGKETLTGVKLLKKAGYDSSSSHYRNTLSQLIKRDILDRNAQGYHLKKI